MHTSERKSRDDRAAAASLLEGRLRTARSDQVEENAGEQRRSADGVAGDRELAVAIATTLQIFGALLLRRSPRAVCRADTILDEITVVGGTTTATQLRQYSTLTPSVMIDPNLLVPGHSYLFETYARLGFPNAATRDYKTIAYPFGTGVVYSSIFTIGS